jgi:hypothetical protein
MVNGLISKYMDTNKQIPNAILGVNVMLLLPIMKEIQIIDLRQPKVRQYLM